MFYNFLCIIVICIIHTCVHYKEEKYMTNNLEGPSWSGSYGSWIYNYLCNQCLSPVMLWVRISIRARCTALCDKVRQWLATGRWFSPGPPVSSTNKTDRHDITGILLKVALNNMESNQYTGIFVIQMSVPYQMRMLA